MDATSTMEELETGEQQWCQAYAWAMVEIVNYPEERRDAMIDALVLLSDYRSGVKIPSWVEEERKEKECHQ